MADNASPPNKRVKRDCGRNVKEMDSNLVISEENAAINLQESFPIKSLETISEVIQNPPCWIKKIEPLMPRTNTIVQNTISDCHIEAKNSGRSSRIDRRFAPKTLVCHDYKGGYLEDRFLQGVSVGNLYSFYNWAHIDIFVYFSHNLITIPPLCWINAAHKNGVKILGTFITEFKDGTKICENILKDEDTMRIFATELAAITKIFKFDGWLLNIENPLPDTILLRKFVSYLTRLIHRDNPENLVIWYDSVIKSGELKWQNELNDSNRAFFDSCDGIFVNYVWTEETIKKSVQSAGARIRDVFVGIDVFGRNTFGGGNFDCYKAAQIARRYGLSIAIFAPGWTHETLPKSGTLLESFQNFVNRDHAFWNSLWPYLYTHPITQPFTTKFSIGTSHVEFDIFAQTTQLSKIRHPKNNSIVPNYTEIPTLNNKCNCIQCVFVQDAVCCLITREYLNPSIDFIHRLFDCDLNLTESTTIVIITKSADLRSESALSLNLTLIKSNGSLKIVKCLSDFRSDLQDDDTLLEVNPTRALESVKEVRKRYARYATDHDLQVTIYQFSAPACNLLEIGCTLEKGNSIILYAFEIENY